MPIAAAGKLWSIPSPAIGGLLTSAKTLSNVLIRLYAWEVTLQMPSGNAKKGTVELSVETVT
jgi:hypothetical protein